jgi:uncharacterized membrane protein
MWVLNQVNKLHRDKSMKDDAIENLKKESISWVLLLFSFISALLNSLMWLICILAIGACAVKNDITIMAWVYFTLYVIVIAILMRQDTKNVTINSGIGLFRTMKYIAVIFFILELLFEVNYGNSSGSSKFEAELKKDYPNFFYLLPYIGVKRYHFMENH